MASSLRYQDHHSEEALANFLDENFYPYLVSNDKSDITFERITDKERQLLGEDCIITAGEQKFIIDEKATMHYLNKMIPTFAFELSSIQNDIERQGWLFDEELLTNYYLLVWPNAKCYDKGTGRYKITITPSQQSLTADSFSIVEAILIRRDSIKLYLEQHGFDEEKLTEDTANIRQTHTEPKFEKIPIPGQQLFYYFYSGQLAEKSINLVIDKKVLIHLSSAVYLISHDGYADITKIAKSKL